MKGKKITELDLGNEEDAAALASVALGPTGNLRAPTAKVGKTWLVGFNEEGYGATFG